MLGDLFYSQEITNIDLIYTGFYTDGFNWFFPGGIIISDVSTTYDPVKRPWFMKVVEIVDKVGVHTNPFQYDPIITNY